MKTRAEAIREATDIALLADWDPTARRRAFLGLCLWPSLAVLILFLLYPLLLNAYVSFGAAGPPGEALRQTTDFGQYASVLRDAEFRAVFLRTIFWTVLCTGAQVAIGVGLAMIAEQAAGRGGRFWTLLLLLPWALPQYIAALTWRGMFAGAHGPVNALLAVFGIAPVDWLHSPVAAFAAMVAVNVWMGFPFMMIVAVAGLRAIPESVYEAARLEGASSWRQFTRLTAPLLRPVMLPATTLGIVWNFNSLNMVWLFSDGGKPSGSTHILSSYVYEAAFGQQRFAWAAALSVVIFAILFLAVQSFLQAARFRR